MNLKLSFGLTITTAAIFASNAATAQSATANVSAPDTTPTAVIAAPVAKKWTCTAEGLAEFRYDGSGWAFIRLSAYTSGHQYRVIKDESGDVAKGTTQDRTPFVCLNK